MTQAALADVYRWVDSGGVVHYSDVPPDEQGERVAVRSTRTDAARLGADAERQSQLDRERDYREGQEAEQMDAEEQRRAEVRKQRDENCRVARERLETYLNSHRLYRPGAEGERDYLSDSEIDAARADARQAVEEWCGASPN